MAVGVAHPNAVRVLLPAEADLTKARAALTKTLPGLSVSTVSLASGTAVTAS